MNIGRVPLVAKWEMMAVWGAMVARSRDYSELAASLAAVAIAGLVSGPVAVGSAALTQGVKFARAKYDLNAAARELRRQVTASIEAWADSEKVSSESVRFGLAEAVRTVDRYGADVGVIADLEFDPEKVAQAVIRAAQAKDKYWGGEEHYD